MKRLRRRLRLLLAARPMLLLAFTATAACGNAPEQDGNPPDADVDVEATGLTESAVYRETDWAVAPGVAAPESAHPYRNNLTEYSTVTAPGCAEAVRLRFERLELRSGDTLTVYDVNGRRVQTFGTGNRRNVWTNAVTGNAVKLRLKTNGSGTAYGFKVSVVQMVAGPIPCPRIAWAGCIPGYVAVAQDQPLCTCPQPPRCEPLADFTASYGTAGGFAGSQDVWTVAGNGEMAHLRAAVLGEPAASEVVGHVSYNRLLLLASEAHSSRMLLDPVASSPSNMTATVQVSQGGYGATVSWPVGTAVPERLTYVVQNFEKAITCGTDPDDAVCALGSSCVEGRCVQAPSCICPRIYQPQCGVFGNTYSNTCALSCAGEALAHEGPCGQAGDACGGLENRGCQDNLSCTFTNQDGTTRQGPLYSGEEGVCSNTILCRCAAVHNPMCGTDGRTYNNPCDLGCRGIPLAHEGACGAVGDLCNADSDCLQGNSCQNQQCVEVGCFCAEIYQPVCGTDGVTYGNSCTLGCARGTLAHDGECGAAGDTCGGIRGQQCHGGNQCRYGNGLHTPSFPDEQGTCRPNDWCEVPENCGHTVRLSCPGTWFCEANACRHECAPPPVETWTTENVTFQSAHPYANNQRLAWTATGDANTRAVRFVFSRVDLEANYDFLKVYNEDWTEVASYSGNLGALTTAEVPGRIAHLVFTSDATITKYGFVGTAVQYKR